jgi:hypothetical protein
MNDDPLDLVGHDLQQHEHDRLQRAALAQMRDDVRWLMAHAQGRRIVWRYLSAAGVYRTTFVAGDGLASAFNEGRRAMGLMLLDDVMTHAPAAHAKMVEEATKGAVVD